MTVRVPRITAGLAVTAAVMLTVGLLSVALPAAPVPTTDVRVAYVPMPGAFGFPRPENDLLAIAESGDLAAQRAHAWEIWAGMTQPTSSELPVFLTWFQSDETYHGVPVNGARPLYPPFLTPIQKTLGTGDPILGFNVFNGALRDFVLKNRYQFKDTLRALIGKANSVQQFPRTAIAVKTVWWPVRADGLTAFPVWDDVPTRPIEWGRGVKALVKGGFFSWLPPQQQADLATHELHGNDFETFARVVAINPGLPGVRNGGQAQVLFFDPDDLALVRTKVRTGRVVPLNRLFHLQINDEVTLKQIAKNPQIPDITSRFWGRPLRRGDYLALVAVHVAAREIPDWVWATFWWHDRPDAAPFGADRADIVPGVFRNYRMRAAFSGILPRGKDGGPHVTFNPYLEAGFSYGPKANCVACHQRSVLEPNGRPGPVFPVRRGQLAKDDPFFANRVQLEFLWSLAFETK